MRFVTSERLSSRLHKILRRMGWSAPDLVAATGASKQSVSRWLSDGKIVMAAEYAFRLQDKSGFSARWISLGEGPELVAQLEVDDDELRAELLRHSQALVGILRRHRERGK